MSAEPRPPRSLVLLVGLLFFVWGLSTVLVDSLVPKLKALFALGYAEVMLTQFSFFLAYLLVSMPAAALLNRLGYARAIVAGLAIMVLGDLGFAPAAALGTFGGFLAALFVTASGITLLQVAANPLMTALGDPATAPSRLTLAQAFNSLGTFIGPFLGASLILGESGRPPLDPATAAPAALAAWRQAEALALAPFFAVIAAALALLALVFWRQRRARGLPPLDQAAPVGLGLDLVRRHRRLALGALTIFLYVGAEVSIGSVLTNYLMQDSVLGWPAQPANRLVALYWGGAMVGRFVGSAVLRRMPAGRALTGAALGAALLAAASAASHGVAAAATLLAVGLANSIMFPTIFSLGLEGLGEETPRGSGLLCLAIVGGAVVPPLTGAVADQAGLATALLVPAACYLWIAAYGALSRRVS